MSKKIKNLKQCHGAIVNEENNDIFDNSKKVSLGEQYKDLEHLSLAELQIIAEDLGLIPESNKKQLLVAIKKQLKRG